MKMVFAMILVMALYDAQAFEVRVSRMTKIPGYSERFHLKNTINIQAALDCQSFVQGLEFGGPGESVIMLAEWECDELMAAMKFSHSHLKKHCLEINSENSVLERHGTCP